VRVAVVHVFMVLSGFSALVYQALWARSFTFVFGSATRSASAVLGAFFLGMAVGSWLAGRRSRSDAAAIRGYGIAEVAIAAASLCVPIWLAAYESAYPALYAWAHTSAWKLSAAQIALALLAMAPPCIAMGATLPLVADALARNAERFGGRVGTTYALNTLGAMLGALAAGFVLPPWIGIARALQLAAGINLLLGVAAIALSARLRGAPRPEAEERTPRSPGLATAAIAAASGFGVLSLEVIYTRLLIVRTDQSALSFAAILAAFLFWLALAAFAVARGIGSVRHPWRALALSQGLAAVTVILAPVLFSDLGALANAASLSRSLWGVILRSVAVMAPTILLVGVALPIAWNIAVRGGAPSAIAVGRLTSVNTLAGVAGALATGFWLLPGLGVSGATKAVAGLYALMAIGSAVRGFPASRAAPVAGGIALAYLGLAFSNLAPPSPLDVSDGSRVVYSYEGEMANVSVTQSRAGLPFLWLNGSYLLGSGHPDAIPAQRMLGELPLWLRPGAEKVAFIGIATGVSVSAALDAPVRRVLALELVPGVIEAARFFSDANRGALSDPRVETMLADGRNHLFATRERFDVVVGDLFVLWHAGVGQMYTAEHFRSVAGRLEPDGVFAQWLPGHNLSPEEIRIITATFASVFPELSLWAVQPAPGRILLALVGSSRPHLDRWQRGDVRQRAPSLALVAGTDTLRRWSARAPINTDDLPRLEYLAARKHFGVVGRTDRVERLVRALTRKEQRAGAS
jgi:spermidine synthase